MNDETREEYLKDQGFHIVRFTNEEVHFHLDLVLESIKEEIKKLSE